MRLLNARFVGSKDKLYTVSIAGGRISDIEVQSGEIQVNSDDYDVGGNLLLPGMVDMHIHSRDPGHTHKEDWQTLAFACGKGGVTAVCDMPNTDPATMDMSSLQEKVKKAANAPVNKKFYLGVGLGNIDQLNGLLSQNNHLICGLKVYYGQSTGELMYSDLERLAEELPNPMPGVLAFHSEDQCCIDKNQELFGKDFCDNNESFEVHSKVRSSEAAYASTKTILDWGYKHGIPLHIAHLSTPAEVELILAAKDRGQVVTSEVAPHHLIFSTKDYGKHGSYIKMNPPVRSEEEVAKLREYFGKGLIEVFATDHAPHTKEEKSEKNYARCPSGVPAIEYYTPLLLTLAEECGLSLESAVAMGASTPAKMVGFEDRGDLAVGQVADLVVMKHEPHDVEPKDIKAKCGWSPYEGYRLNYKVAATFLEGNMVYGRELN